MQKSYKDQQRLEREVVIVLFVNCVLESHMKSRQEVEPDGDHLDE